LAEIARHGELHDSSLSQGDRRNHVKLVSDQVVERKSLTRHVFRNYGGYLRVAFGRKIVNFGDLGHVKSGRVAKIVA
jgi:hypothetical protein